MPERLDQQNLARKFLPYFLIAPAIAYYAAFWLQPAAAAIRGSLLDGSGDISLENYRTIFQDPVFRRALFNTAVIVVFSVSLEFVAALGVALLVNRKFKGSSIFLFITLIPMALPPVAVGAIWSSGFATYGWLNSFLAHLGISEAGERVAFLAGGDFRSLLIIILIDAWQVIPFMVVILLAGLRNLQPELVEAGYVFGGGPWTVFRRITMPLLRPTIRTALLLRIISAVQIWLIIVMLFGFRRIPVLLEEVVFYQEQLSGDANMRIALAYAVVTAIIVCSVSVLYLKTSLPETDSEEEASC